MFLVLLVVAILSITAVSAAVEELDMMLKDAAAIQKDGDTDRALHILRYVSSHFPKSAKAHYQLGMNVSLN
jgi:TolA-binding protein